MIKILGPGGRKLDSNAGDTGQQMLRSHKELIQEMYGKYSLLTAQNFSDLKPSFFLFGLPSSPHHFLKDRPPPTIF